MLLFCSFILWQYCSYYVEKCLHPFYKRGFVLPVVFFLNNIFELQNPKVETCFLINYMFYGWQSKGGSSLFSFLSPILSLNIFTKNMKYFTKNMKYFKRMIKNHLSYLKCMTPGLLSLHCDIKPGIIKAVTNLN